MPQLVCWVILQGDDVLLAWGLVWLLVVMYTGGKSKKDEWQTISKQFTFNF